MKLYISDTPVTFPQSEYGGTIAITANNVSEWGDILRTKYEYELEKGDFDIDQSLSSLKEFPLAEDCESEVVYEFLT